MYVSTDHTGKAQAYGAAAVIDDNGISLFDIADFYSNGALQEVLSLALKHKRHNTLLLRAVKLGTFTPSAGLSNRLVLISIDGTVCQLGTDQLSVYLYRPDCLVDDALAKNIAKGSTQFVTRQRDRSQVGRGAGALRQRSGGARRRVSLAGHQAALSQ